MPTHWGYEGVVRVGSNTIAEVTEFEITQSVSPVDDTAMGDLWKTHIAGSGIKEWSGSLTCHWDETDTNGQEALTVGASVTLNLYPEGNQATDKFYTGLASITEVKITTKMDGDTIKRSFNFQGSGALTLSAVP
jgi:lipopolysaccharide biosynthesis protein